MRGREPLSAWRPHWGLNSPVRRPWNSSLSFSSASHSPCVRIVASMNPSKRTADSPVDAPPKRQKTIHNYFDTEPEPAASTLPTLPPQDPPADVPVPEDSKTLAALKQLDTAAALLTWERLRDGYTDKSGKGYGPAIRTPAGCLLCQKAPNRDVSPQRKPPAHCEQHLLTRVSEKWLRPDRPSCRDENPRPPWRAAEVQASPAEWPPPCSCRLAPGGSQTSPAGGRIACEPPLRESPVHRAQPHTCRAQNRQRVPKGLSTICEFVNTGCARQPLTMYTAFDSRSQYWRTPIQTAAVEPSLPMRPPLPHHCFNRMDGRAGGW